MLIAWALIITILGAPDSSAAFIDTAHLWEKKALSVCLVSRIEHLKGVSWAKPLEEPSRFDFHFESNPGLRAAAANKVRAILEGSSLADVTGFSILGWKDCDAPDAYARADVLLMIEKSRKDLAAYGFASIGNDPANSKQLLILGGLLSERSNSPGELLGMKSLPLFQTLSRQIAVGDGDWVGLENQWKSSELNPGAVAELNAEAVILHEWGHILGLLHEQEHPKANEGLQAIASHSPRSSASRPLATSYGIPYDPLSVMMYGQNEDYSFFALLKVVCRDPQRRLSEEMNALCPEILSTSLTVDYSLRDLQTLGNAYGAMRTSSERDFEALYRKVLKVRAAGLPSELPARRRGE